MNVYSIIIQKIFNISKNIYAIKKMSNLKIKLPNLQNKLFIQPVLSSNIYTKYLNNQLWETIYINGELSIDLNENKSNNFLLIKYIFYLYIFNPIHNINRLNNTTNYSSPKQIGALTNWLNISSGYFSKYLMVKLGLLFLLAESHRASSCLKSS